MSTLQFSSRKPATYSMHNRNGEILVTTQVCIKSLQQTFYNNIAVNIINKPYYYMALSHKDWELPNSRI